MKLSTLLTFGLLPLIRRSIGISDEDPRRDQYISLCADPWGMPSFSKVERVLRKYYKGQELQCVLSRVKHMQDIFVRSEVYESLYKDLEKLRLVRPDDGPEYHGNPFHGTGTIFNGEGYIPSSAYQLCRSCGRAPVRFFIDFDEFDNNALTCSSCGSSDVLDPMDLSLKEFKKHVETFRKSSPKSRDESSATVSFTSGS